MTTTTTPKSALARARFLSNLELKANDRAKIVGIRHDQIHDFLAALVVEGLIDGHHQITRKGAAYRFVALGREPDVESKSELSRAIPKIDFRAVWRRLGGDEETVRRTLDILIAEGWVEERAEEYFAVL